MRGLIGRYQVLIGGLICAIVVAHGFLWTSDMPTGLKLTFTLLNVLGWGLVFAPVFLVDKWLSATRDRNARGADLRTRDSDVM